MMERVTTFFKPDELRPTRFVFVLTAMVMLISMITGVVLDWRQLPADTLLGPGQMLFTYYSQSPNISALAWSPNGARLASNDGTVRIWDATTGRHALTLALPATTSVSSLAWSPDSKSLAVGGSSLTIWDTLTGQSQKSYTFSARQSSYDRQMHIASLAWSPNGTMLAAASNYTITTKHRSKENVYVVNLWKTANGQQIFTYHGHKNTITTVIWSPDSKRIASSSNDQTLQTWDALTGKQVVKYSRPAGSAYTWIDWSPNGKMLAAINGQTIDLWQAGSDTLIHSLPNQSGDTTVRWSPDGTKLATGYHDVHIWDASTGKLLFTHAQNPVQALAWSPDGKLLASVEASNGSGKGITSEVQVWSAP